MIPTIEEIVAMLLAGECTGEQAIGWLKTHIELEQSSDLVSVPMEALRVLEAAKTLMPLLDEGWDEYDLPEDQNAGGKACDELIAATEAWLAAAEADKEGKA